MRSILFIALCFFLGYVASQQVGTLTPENHPSLAVQTCTRSGCTNVQGSIVLDSNWRWLHTTTGSTNCFTGNAWDSSICPDPATCTKNCALDGADYQGTYGITAGGNSVTLKFVTHGPYSTNIGSRVYLLKDENTYQVIQLKGKEFTFDVDVSNLPCGLNGALYFVEMQGDGGKSAHPTNAAGAKYGTGYCDAQCPHDMKFISGEANINNWKPSPNDPNSGSGQYGTCCAELDIWEANKISSAYTAHVCTTSGPYRCSGSQCGDGSDRYGGVCDKDGCDFNSYRTGVKNFYGPGATVDTNKPITVVTQFVTSGNELSEIRRLWVQNGKVIHNSAVTEPGIKAYDSVSEAYCTDTKKLFGDKNDFETKGGFKAFGAALDRGMVLVMSLWDDHDAQMLWLDSNYPLTGNPSTPGVARGSCPTSSGKPSDVESQYPNSSVTFSNIKWGDLNTTFTAHNW